MEKYIVKVNNVEYEVEITDVKENNSGANFDSSDTVKEENNSAVDENKFANQGEVKNQENQSGKQQDTEQTEQVSTNDSGDMKAVKAPMSGTILSIRVDIGQQVEKGETIMTLEAMKMETEISAPVSGEIGDIKIGEGDNCENGTVIALIKEAE